MSTQHEQRVIDAVADRLRSLGALDPAWPPERVPSPLDLMDGAAARFRVTGRGAMVVIFFLRPQPTEEEVLAAIASAVRAADQVLATPSPSLGTRAQWRGEGDMLPEEEEP